MSDMTHTLTSPTATGFSRCLIFREDGRGFTRFMGEPIPGICRIVETTCRSENRATTWTLDLASGLRAHNFPFEYRGQDPFPFQNSIEDLRFWIEQEVGIELNPKIFAIDLRREFPAISKRLAKEAAREAANAQDLAQSADDLVVAWNKLVL